MKAIYRYNDNLSFEVEGETLKDVLPQVGEAKEIMMAARQCEKCRKEDKTKGFHINFRKRKSDKHDFYEAVCLGCFAVLRLGVRDDGSGALFPQRKNWDTKENLPDKGWMRYDADKGEKY